MVSLAIAISVLGDAALYTVLPIYAETLGIRITFVGILLSANRFVRLVTNTWSGAIHDRFQSFWPFVVALVVGAMTTMMYGLGWGFASFLAARLLWGTCWSFLRLEGYAAVISDAKPNSRGRLMGIHKSIVSSGMMAGGFLGGVLTDTIGYRNCLFTFAGMTLLGAVLLMVERWQDSAANGKRKQNPLVVEPPEETDTSLPRAGKLEPVLSQWMLYLMGFTNVLVNGGMVGSTLSRLFKIRFGMTLTLGRWSVGVASATGTLGVIRWLVSFVLAPVLGHGADRFGRRPLLLSGFLLGSAALLGLIKGSHVMWLSLAAVMVSVSRSAISVSLDAAVADLASNARRGQLVSRFVTFMDLGSACGPLFSYLLLGANLKIEWVYLGGLCLLLLLSVVAIRVRPRN